MSLKTNLYQSQQLRQEMKMNPRLYQAMELLYMPLLDLQQHLKQELAENPFLELSEPDVGDEPAPEEPAAESSDDEIDWEEILLDGFDTGGWRPQYEEREYYQPPVVSTRDLADHLLDQLRLLSLSHRQHILGEEIIGDIGDDGYLACPLEELLASLNDWLAQEAERRRQSGDGRSPEPRAPSQEAEPAGAETEAAAPARPAPAAPAAPAAPGTPGTPAPDAAPSLGGQEVEWEGAVFAAPAAECWPPEGERGTVSGTGGLDAAGTFVPTLPEPAADEAALNEAALNEAALNEAALNEAALNE
ncbi:MAG: hypothetical protein HY704_08110, partial [Gemmatimonadetes bacterium]|nr:hypothetical protein [Gemmatimonadota bacterium]